MARTTKAPEVRRQEIIDTAGRLFRENGYSKCSVEMIIREIGVAKGTFYYYFKSKEQILDAITEQTMRGIVDAAQQVADDASLDAMGKMEALLSDTHIGDKSSLDVAEMLHLPENRELHEATNTQTILQLSPVLAQIVEQGNAEGVFAADRPLETIQVLLTGAHFLLDGGLFEFSEAEKRARREVVQSLLEQALNAAPGSFGFMNPNPTEG